METTVSPSELVQELKVCLERKLTPYITSSPGMGKSSIVSGIAKAANLKLLDLRLSQCTPEDLQGFPMRTPEGKATFTPFDIFPLQGEDKPLMLNAKGEQVMMANPKASEPGEPAEIPRRMNGWLLLLDELSSANKAVQAAAYKLILDRQVGSFDLHDDVYMVACGNKITDKAVVHKMSTALQSRMIHFTLETATQDWVNWAIKKGFDYRILGFIQFRPDLLMNFDPDHTDKTYACPRTWEFLDNLINGEEVHPQRHQARVAGTIGSGAAIEFLSFCEIHSNLPDWNDIIDPAKNATMDVPAEPSTRYAVITMIASRIEKGDVSKVLPYIQKFTPDFEIIFCRGILSRFPNIDRTSTDFIQYAMTMITDMQKP